MNKNRAMLLWSGGKDAVLALHEAREQQMEICGLCTTMDPDRNRVNMHDVPMNLIEKQAASLGLELHSISIGNGSDVAMYRKSMISAFERYKEQDITHIIAGDIYLDDVKEWREGLIEEAGLKPYFPIWKESTHVLMKRFVSLGFRAVVICANARYLDASWLGRELDQRFIDDLPALIDPCGEQGEYHTFVNDGPGFEFPVEFRKGPARMEDFNPEGEDVPFDTKFWYLDLLPTEY